MANICITYLWQPERWTKHPLPHTFGDIDIMDVAQEYIAHLTFMGFDELWLSAFPDTANTHGEYERARRFLDILAGERAAGRTKLTACVYYEPYREPAQPVADRLHLMREMFDWYHHPAYTRVDGRPKVPFWRCENRIWEQAIRDAKRLYMTMGDGLWPPPYVVPRIRTNWLTEAHHVIDMKLDSWLRLDERYQYPQAAYKDTGAYPFSVSFNSAAVKASTQEWLLPEDPLMFKAALMTSVPAGVHVIMRDYEENEAGNLLVKGREHQYMTMVRRALVGA